ncbi:MAG: hypothetical protein PWP04_1008 [Candidatus Atribacteria bacterium]|nr:hypothetical protein [Candidatus Atribacteria bacterium]
MTGKKISILGVFLGIGLVLHLVESLFPPPLPLPGVKLGLANVVTLVVLFLGSIREAFLVSFFRIILGSLLGGTFLQIGFFISLGGGITSFLTMAAAKKMSCSLMGTSVIGALSHNLGQVIVVFLFLGTTAIFWYLPLFLLIALPCGIFIGYLGWLFFRFWPNKSL